jgi:hypothetical protein
MVHPVRIVVTDDLRRSRLTVLFRLVLAVPHFLWATLWTGSLTLFVPFQWLWALIAGRLEPEVHALLVRFVRYQLHLEAYVLLLANPWPRFGGRSGYPVDVELDPPAQQRRLAIWFRLVLALPALVFSSVLLVVVFVLAVLGWFAALVLGRLPEGMGELGAYCLRYQMQTFAYVVLLTSAYPSLAGDRAAGHTLTRMAAERE